MNKHNSDNHITIIGRTNFRNDPKQFGIKKPDRRYHMYVIGKTGTGKSTLIENLVFQDIRKGEGLAVLDPHGDFIERIADMIPMKRDDDLIYFNVPDPLCPFGFNPLESVAPEKRPLIASGMVDAFKKIWGKTWGPRMEHILRNTMLTLLDQPNATLADVARLYRDSDFRKEAAGRVSNPQVKEFWKKDFPKYGGEAIDPIMNKIGAFLSDPHLQRVLTKGYKTFDIRKIMDEGKILLVNLAKGRLGPDNSSLLGALLLSRMELAALSRADIPEKERRDFYLYLDEFQNFTTLSMANMLSELRKYHLNIIISHQYLDQLEEEVRNAVLGNVGTTISFRVGVKDAYLLEKEFYPKFSASDLINLPNYSIYLKLMIDGKVSQPFSADTLPPVVIIHDNPEYLQTAYEFFAGKNYPCYLASSWEEGMGLVSKHNPGMILSGEGLAHWIKMIRNEE